MKDPIEHLKALAAARRAYDQATAAYRAAPAGPLREACQQALYAAGDVVNLIQGCTYTATTMGALLAQAHDALDGMADSDIDHFEDDEEEAEAVPAQYAARKVMEAIQLLHGK